MAMLVAHVVSHTHWDREWYLTREQFRLRLVDLIDRVLDRLEADAGFLFHLDGQTIVLEDYLEVRPGAAERLRAHVAGGRLLVGPWYVMPDQFLVSGESLVRNLALGHRIAASFGGAMAAGYIPDPFGHVAQMPQLLRGFGLDAAILWRGLGPGPAERLWEAPDGSRVLLLHLPSEGYCNALRLPLKNEDAMPAAAAEVVGRESARSAGGHLLLMAGVDHVEPHQGLATLVRVLDALPGVTGRLSTLPAFVAGARQGTAAAALPLVRGELRSGQDHAFLLPGVLSARQYLKQANARAQRELEHRAEPLSVFAWMAGAAYPQPLLEYAWRTLLQNHPHDSICGCSVDAVHEENATRFARVQQVAEGLAERALQSLAGAVEAPPAGTVRCLAAHTDASPFAGIVEVAIDLPYASAEPGHMVDAGLLEVPYTFVPRDQELAAVTGPDGQPVAFQVLGQDETTVYAMSRFEPPWPLRARRLRVLLALDVPAAGYTTFDAHFGSAPRGAERVAHPATAGERWLDNGLLRVEVNGDGTLALTDRRAGRSYGRCLELEDGGDAGDEYTYCPPARDRVVGSQEAVVHEVAVIERGPLRAGLHVRLSLPVPEALAADRQARAPRTVSLPVTFEVHLAAGSARVDVEVVVDNAGRDHRLRLLAPTASGPVAASRADSAFALVERPAAAAPAPPAAKEDPVATAPMLSFADAGDQDAGLTVFADGLSEYEVLAGPAPRMAVTLLRCVGFLSRDDLATRRGHAGPGLATPGAQCPGRHRFRLALAPRSAPPAAAELHAQARAFLSPPRVAAHAGGSGRLPRAQSFLHIDGGVVLSACKRADEREAIVLRVFNPGTGSAEWAAGAGELARLCPLDLREREQGEPRPRLEVGAGAIATAALTR